MNTMENTPAAAVAVTNPPPQAVSASDPRSWADPWAWTPRMLARLAASGPATKWFRLWDKVMAETTLRSSFRAVWRNRGSPGVDGQTVAQFDQQLAAELAQLGAELRTKTYHRQPARRTWVPKLGSTELRPLGIPAVRDRTVEGALRRVLEPIFEHDFAESSYGFRPGRTCQQAVARVEELLGAGHVWCVDADLKSYFDTIPHERLLALLQARVVDGSVLALVQQCLQAGVMEDCKHWVATACGTPQGAVISPLLANVYLNPLDQELLRRGWRQVRYADDFVVLCDSREEAEEVLVFLREWTQAVGLTLHPTKTRLVNAATEGFDFLGWHFRGGHKWPRRKSVQKLRETLRPLTRRTNGHCFGAIVARLNPILRGWHGYFRDSVPGGLSGPDGWLRRRLRAMFRKREKRPGYGLSKADSKQWPNRWFAERGLFSLEHGSCSYG